MTISQSRPLFVAFVNRHPEFGDITGKHDLAVYEIASGQKLELGAITVERPLVSDHLDWVNQQEDVPTGMLLIGETIKFESGERLGLFYTQAKAEKMLAKYLKELHGMAADLL